MLQKLKKILALFMVLTVLVSSHSFAYFEHLCTITKIKSLSFNLETCSGDYLPINQINDLPSISKGDCCDIEFKYNVADNAVQHDFDLKLNSFIAEIIEKIHFEFKPSFLIISQESILTFSDSSPPLKQAIYIINQQFRL